jgi:hypothetical protein
MDDLPPIRVNETVFTSTGRSAMNNLVIGVDIAKRVFQLHWVEESGEIKSVQFGEMPSR